MSWPAIGGLPTLQLGMPGVLVAFTTPATVSTETPLYALTELGPRWSRVWITVRNHHASSWAEAIVDRSESGSVNDELRQRKRVPPLGEATFTFDDTPAREVSRMFALSASGDPDAAYPSITVSWQVRVQRRPVT